LRYQFSKQGSQIDYAADDDALRKIDNFENSKIQRTTSTVRLYHLCSSKITFRKLNMYFILAPPPSNTILVEHSIFRINVS